MDKQLTTSILLAVLLFGYAVSLSAQNYGKPYQPFRPYKRGMAEMELATMPRAQISGNIGATSAYMLTTSMPQGEIYEPFTASTPSGATPRRSSGPGSGGKDQTDVPPPDIAPVGDGLVALLLFAILFAVGKGVAMRAKKRAL